eukprot:COSAG01_NODE_58843_length_303_cov_1.446078_1_plen_78_part_10
MDGGGGAYPGGVVTYTCNSGYEKTEGGLTAHCDTGGDYAVPTCTGEGTFRQLPRNTLVTDSMLNLAMCGCRTRRGVRR